MDEFRVDFSVLFDLDSCCCLTTGIFFGDGDRAFSNDVFFWGEGDRTFSYFGVCFWGKGDRTFSIGLVVFCGNGDRVSSTDLRVFWGEGDREWLLTGFSNGFCGEILRCFLISVFLTYSCFSTVALFCFCDLIGEAPRMFYIINNSNNNKIVQLIIIKYFNQIPSIHE